MCTSHRALTGDGAPVVDLCVQCQQARATAGAKEAQQRAERDQRAYDDVKVAVQLLKDAGVAPQKIYHATIRKKTAFGGFREIEYPAGHIYGWPLGEYEWISGKGGANTFTTQTFITKKRRLAASHSQREEPTFCDITFHIRVFGSTVVPPTPADLLERKVEFLDEIADKLKRLI